LADRGVLAERLEAAGYEVLGRADL
jgi:hypothetical protein